MQRHAKDPGADFREVFRCADLDELGAEIVKLEKAIDAKHHGEAPGIWHPSHGSALAQPNVVAAVRCLDVDTACCARYHASRMHARIHAVGNFGSDPARNPSFPYALLRAAARSCGRYPEYAHQ